MIDPQSIKGHTQDMEVRPRMRITAILLGHARLELGKPKYNWE